MLRAVLVLLFVANVLMLAWGQGWLGGARAPASRLTQQLNPEQLTPLGQQDARQLAHLACLDLGPLEGDEAVQRAQRALEKAGVPSSSWQLQTTEAGGVWGVATIKMPSKDFQARKEETYRRARIAFEPLPGFPSEQPSLLLSRHDSPAAAEKALDALNDRNYKGLRVLALQPPKRQTVLRLARIDGLQLGRVSGIKDAPWGAAQKRCDAAEAAAAPAAAGSAGSGASAPASAGSR